MKVGIGVDIGGTHITSCGVDLLSGQLIESSRFESDVDSGASKEEILSTWAKPINESLKALGTSVTGIGFGMPGSFNYKDGIALFSGNAKYEALYQVNVKDELKTYLDRTIMDLRFINDASAFAVGTAWFGKARGHTRALCLTLGTGFGSCFVERGRPVVNSETVPEHGCLWHLPFGDSIADNYFSTRWFVSQFYQRTGEHVKGVKEMIDSAYSEVVKELFHEFGENMAAFVGPWLEKFQPGIIVVGGNISRAWKFIGSSFDAYLAGHSLSVKVVTSGLMVDAAISGSARLNDAVFWKSVAPDLPER
ncbi:ROK family protein [Marinoscillum sp.]|uniref:ROK family protein n=1 Tax=Marinoscillum sp. TaxID=2024838 RepID=UPI003BAAB6E9